MRFMANKQGKGGVRGYKERERVRRRRESTYLDISTCLKDWILPNHIVLGFKGYIYYSKPVIITCGERKEEVK